MNRTITAVLASVCIPAALTAQQPGGDDPIGRQLFAPELVMQHQRSIGLTPEQRQRVTEAIQQFQSRIVELQWEMQDQVQRLVELLGETSIDEPAALEQIDRVLAVEHQIKRAHLGVLVRIKNMLDPNQQAELRRLRATTGRGRNDQFPGNTPGGSDQ